MGCVLNDGCASDEHKIYSIYLVHRTPLGRQGYVEDLPIENLSEPHSGFDAGRRHPPVQAQDW